MHVKDSVWVLTLVSCLTVVNTTWAATLPVAGAASNLFIDRRLTIEKLNQSTVTLNEVSCKVVALELMAKLALLGAPASTSGVTSPPTPAFPGVTIFGGTGTPGTEINVEFLLWGIQAAMTEFITSGIYLETSFDILWAGWRVGIMEFRRTETLQASKPAVQTPPGQGSVLSPPIEPLSATGRLTKVTLTILPNARRLDGNHVFLAMYEMIAGLAGINKDTEFVGTSTNSFHDAPELSLIISSVDGHGLPREEPPYMLFETIIDVCRRIPFYLASAGGDFKEIKWEASVDYPEMGGFTLGRGVLCLRGGPDCDVDP
ncbi:MAG: hypothetical protein LQ348_003250 [Seirophora lacunosa]|nr:MAG: hypothetical protein LQ348_003250 [Seirophora lacunosa]